MARKLVIENIVKVPVKFTLNNNGKLASFAFSVTCTRLDQNEIKALFDGGDAQIVFSEFLPTVIHGWEGQKLVVEEDGTPAEFDAESLGMLLSIPGVSATIYTAYMKECAAKEKN